LGTLIIVLISDGWSARIMIQYLQNAKPIRLRDLLPRAQTHAGRFYPTRSSGSKHEGESGVMMIVPPWAAGSVRLLALLLLLLCTSWYFDHRFFGLIRFDQD